jgi:Arc/MetJ family transcription regulator
MCIGGVDMRTNIVLDDELVDKAMKYTGIKTKRELVNFALKELLDRKERKSILRLEGKLCWEGDLGEMRRARFSDTD